MIDLSRWDRRGFVLLPRALAGVDAVTLSTIIDLFCLRQEQGRVVNGWIRYSVEHLCHRLWNPISRHTLRRVLLRLEQAGCITTRGEKRTRELTVHPHTIHHLRIIARKARNDSHQTQVKGFSTDPPKGVSVHSNNTRNKILPKNQNTPPETPPTQFTCISIRKGTDWCGMAEKLHTSISRVRQLPGRKNLHQWAEAIKRIHITDGFSPQQVQSAVDWYSSTIIREGDLITNGNPNFIPVVYSGATMRVKFQKVLDAMARSGHRTGTKQAPRLIISPDPNPTKGRSW